jgi:hypothetical protein
VTGALKKVSLYMGKTDRKRPEFFLLLINKQIGEQPDEDDQDKGKKT